MTQMMIKSPAISGECLRVLEAFLGTNGELIEAREPGLDATGFGWIRIGQDPIIIEDGAGVRTTGTGIYFIDAGQVNTEVILEMDNGSSQTSMGAYVRGNGDQGFFCCLINGDKFGEAPFFAWPEVRIFYQSAVYSLSQVALTTMTGAGPVGPCTLRAWSDADNIYCEVTTPEGIWNAQYATTDLNDATSVGIYLGSTVQRMEDMIVHCDPDALVCPTMPEMISFTAGRFEGYGQNVSQAFVRAGFGLVDGEVWVSYYVSPTTTWPSEVAVTPFPIPAADLWFRWVDNYTPRSKASTPGANDGWSIYNDGAYVALDFGDTFQITSETEFRLIMPAGFGSEFPRRDQTFDVFLEICLDCNGTPDGNWYRKHIASHNSTSGAIEDFDWWGGELQVYDEGGDPNPKMEFLRTQGGGSGPDLTGHCNVEYTTAVGLAYMSYWNSSAGPLPLGQYVVNWSSFTGSNLDNIIAKDRDGNIMDEEDDYELIECTFELDFSADPVGTYREAVFWVFVMDSTDQWAEVQRRVRISGTKSEPSLGTGAFIMSATTDDTWGAGGNYDFRLPCPAGYTYDFYVDWGDGTAVEHITTSGNHTHNYGGIGTWDVSITGAMPALRYGYSGQNWGYRVREIKKWGGLAWEQWDEVFGGCEFMTITAVDVPDISLVTSCSEAFNSCIAMTGGLSYLGTENVEDMYGMFLGCENFNEPLYWDVGNVLSMSWMFGGYNSSPPNGFNGDISSWRPTSCIDYEAMFYQSIFNRPVNAWGTSFPADVNFDAMFQSCPFNQSLSNWEFPGTAVDMGGMFRDNTAFNRDLSSWNVEGVTDFFFFMNGATAFSTANYDLLLNAWSLQNLNPSESINFSSSYTIATSQAARDIITGTYLWSVTDLGGI